MYLGDKYNVHQCVTDCIAFMKRSLNNENTCSGLYYAILHDHPELTRLCKERIISDTEAIFITPGFLKCGRQALEYILKMDFVSCSEDKVFEAVMAWVMARSNQNVLTKEIVDTHLGDLFYQIRFASMTIQQLCALRKKYDSVFSNDFATIVDIVAEPGIQVDKFVTTPRRFKWRENDCLNFDRKSNRYTYSYTLDLNSDYKTTLSSNTPVILGSFTCSAVVIADDCDGHDLDWDLSVEVKITEASATVSNNSEVISSMTAILGSTATAVRLPQPILIRPGFVYTICFGPFPCEHQYRSQMLKKKWTGSSGIVIEVHDDYRDEDDDEYDDEYDSLFEDYAPGLISEFNFNFI